MSCLVCLLEEPSAEEMLRGVLSRIIPDDIYVHYMVFEGKQDLDKRLEQRLRLWQRPDSVFLIMRDKDSGNCVTIKQSLLEKVTASRRRDTTLVRIACHELESFYLGDLHAVEQGLQLTGLSRQQNKQKYRVPDNLANASEELIKLTEKRYSKIAGSRAISPYLTIDGSNKSNSFNVLLSGVCELTRRFLQ